MRLAFLGVFPLKLLQQFRRLDANGDGHVLGIVKLFPIPRIAESIDAGSEITNGIHAAA